MDLETRSKELDIGLEDEGPSVIDLNQATAEELDALPGIGPSLARRIVNYRAERGGFRSPDELASVPGVGHATYEQLAARLTVVPLETDFGMPGMYPSPASPTPVAGEAAPEEIEQAGEHAAYPAPQAPAPVEAPPSEAETGGLDRPKAVPKEEPIPPPKEPPVAEKEPLAAPLGSATPQRGGRSSLSWLWASLLGGLLGMVFTLLVFSGINGSLDLGNSRAVLDVQSSVSNLAAETNSLRGEIDGLRQRLGALEGLTARMEKAESAVENLRQETEDLDQQAGALESELVSVAEELSTVQAETHRVTTFFGRLQALLQDVFGMPPAATPEPPAETPTPTP